MQSPFSHTHCSSYIHTLSLPLSHLFIRMRVPCSKASTSGTECKEIARASFLFTHSGQRGLATPDSSCSERKKLAQAGSEPYIMDALTYDVMSLNTFRTLISPVLSHTGSDRVKKRHLSEPLDPAPNTGSLLLTRTGRHSSLKLHGRVSLSQSASGNSGVIAKS